ncbi:alpha-amylase family protein [uncultured Tateyamaria sp.]|uniref:alpha-amylase family protein n=1 Tax=uncultured Tateyamaria sp. TaxID=455651 RepID=UPI0026041777|nr:alpha-amylase family protein [uncultured Tateyamaria sp.]
MRFRQIHLDFHTSPEVPGVGSKFDSKTFARTLKGAHVNSINLFAKCHHGYSYHPTKVGKMHPHLDFDLLRAQIDALQAEGIKTPIYITAAWDELAAAQHPEWIIVDPKTGEKMHNGTDGRQGWYFLDLSSPYKDYLYAQIEEVIELFPDAGGFWIDICHQHLSVGDPAVAQMRARGMDPDNQADLIDFAESASLANLDRISTMARHAGLPVFFNFGHLRRGRSDVLRTYFSHLEIESLPTAEWGYDHFPVSARYVEALGMDYLGMTGKFHHLWGDMGGYKKPEALIYECGAMLAHGARICIGDHLHPTGRIDPSTYANVGKAFEWVAACEQWCEGTSNVAEIGLISTEAIERPRYAGPSPHHNTIDDGAVRVLLEHKFTFDVLDADSDFSAYRLLILPDAIPINADLAVKLQSHVDQGGRLLLTGSSGIGADGEMLFPAGTIRCGVSAFSGGDFALPTKDLRADFVDEPLFMYGPSQQLKLDGGASLGSVFDPYLNREGRRFSGHLHAPNRPDPNGFVFGARLDGVTRLAHPVFGLYHKVGAPALLDIIGNVISQALDAPRQIASSLPVAGRATLRRNEAQHVLHLLYANPILRGRLRGDNVQPIQDIVPLHDVDVTLQIKDASRVTLQPQGTELRFRTHDGSLSFSVPNVTGHQMIVVE